MLEEQFCSSHSYRYLVVFSGTIQAMDLNTPLKALTGIGPNYAKKLEYLGLFTLEDLINHYPFRYDDFSSNQALSQVSVGEKVTLKGEVWSIKNTHTRFGKVLTQAVFNDGTGTIELVWFNQPWLTKSINTGDSLQVSGKINRKGNKLSLVFPVWEKLESSQSSVVSNQTIHTGRLIPVYPETYGITSKWLRTKIAKLLPFTTPKIIDSIPDFLIKDKTPLNEALKQIHFPDNLEQAKKARERLGFDELFYIQLTSLKTRKEWQEKELTQAFKIKEEKLKDFIKNLPFELTSAQTKVTQEIIEDLKKDHPMNRLVQGDVGSGKTIVATIAAFLAYLNGLKTVIMAPTEILAFQHHETLSKLLTPYGVGVGVYTGSRKYTQGIGSRVKGLEKGKSLTPYNLNPKPSIIVGTHALLSKKLKLDNVGLVVIDEQQRFGVEQRSLLRTQASSPHFLTMTATPIPRTVALTLYGDLDLSVIDEMPVGRKIVRTHFVPQKKRADAYQFIDQHIKQGFQTYIITPLIEESETLISAKAAKVEFERLQKDIFPNLKLGLLHGKLKSKEKEDVLNDFKNHKIDILVSTSVVEVGVDVPNATIMVIEGAERFGLAQLHQLRGRVGRGEVQSFAFLFTEMETPQIINRLKHLEKIHDGLKLSEIDLQIRGAGEVFGTLQSGRWNLKIASLSDLKLIEETRTAASKILQDNPNLDKYPLLASKLLGQGKTVMPD